MRARSTAINRAEGFAEALVPGAVQREAVHCRPGTQMLALREAPDQQRSIACCAASGARPDRQSLRQGGFTLVEILAALAIASVIILASAALTRNVALFFDRGTRDVGEAERLMLAVDRLAADFGSARFVYPASAVAPEPDGRGLPNLATAGNTAAGSGAVPASDTRPAGGAKQTVLFTAEPGKIVFVAAGGVAARGRGEEVITLTIESSDGVTRLVRRRAPWSGPRDKIEDLPAEDPVVLIEGRVDIAFAFGRIAPDGSLTWSDVWSGESVLPRFVRVSVRDRATGADLLAAAEFVLRADAPPACAQESATAGCLSGVSTPEKGPGAQAQPAAQPPPPRGPSDVL
jgi:prepilin-type N-terminal cleavage/methylation domain-containing protein